MNLHACSQIDQHLIESIAEHNFPTTATKFRPKAAAQADFVVPPLEALWCGPMTSLRLTRIAAMSGIGRLMLMQPDHVSEEDVADVLDVIVQR